MLRYSGPVLFAAVFVSLTRCPDLAAQSQPELARIELAAARAMLARQDVPNDHSAIEPRFAKKGEAPGVVTRDATERPADRSASLARSLKGRVARIEDVRSCPTCPFKKVRSVLLLSEPVVSDGVAVITVTAYYNSTVRIATEYETVEFRLQQRDGTWVVIESHELGVS
jgi:hypothetical protein